MIAPRETSELHGQAEAEARLLSALRSGRMPHAWLFTGRPGIGKATLAFRLARYLLAYPEGRPALVESLGIDPEEPTFRQVAVGSHPDLTVLQRAVNEKTGKLRGEILVEAVRDAGQSLRRTASAGGWRVLIVDSADEMNRAAANSLLKVLEEPPPRTLVILIGHAPAALLPTLRSRCCSLPLAPLSPEVLEPLIVEHLPEVEAEQRRLLAALAEGSIGQALALQAAGGLELYRRTLTILNRTGQGLDTAEAHALAEELGRDSSGERFRTTCGLLTWWLARAVKAAARQSLPEPLTPEEEGLAERLFARRALADWVGLWEKLTALTQQAERANLDRKQAFLSALIELNAAG
ncbi:MAG: DNA polymerase III subunit delta' [Rhodospirillales bacterium]